MEEDDLSSFLTFDTQECSIDLDGFDWDAFLTGGLSKATDAIFDAFFNGEPSQGANASTAVQNESLALSQGKKRRSNATIQPRVKRQRIQHSHICDVHRAPSSRPSVICFGKWSSTGPYKGARCSRPVTTFVDGQLPVCTQHRSQIMDMRCCEAVLECGYPCNEMIPWKAHGFPLCEAHWSQGRCGFLELPVEIRLMIYRYLLPLHPVPARWSSVRRFRSRISTAIFRVNKAIHEEVADLFYGETTFEVEITNDPEGKAAVMPGIFMCYARDDRTTSLRAITAMSAASHSCSSLWKLLGGGIQFDSKPWQLPLSSGYFQRIRSFRLNITFCISPGFPFAGNSSQSMETTVWEAERNFLCDYLHQFAERLMTDRDTPLRRLDVSVRIRGILNGDCAQANAKAMTHCEALIKPIRRLRARSASIASLNRSAIWEIGEMGEVDMLSAYLKDEDSTTEFVRSCCAELTDLSAPPPVKPVLLRFGELAQTISAMRRHPFWRQTDLEEMEFLLSNGRSAREANDMKAMLSVFRGVFDKLKKYHSEHQTFMKEMALHFGTMRSNEK